MTDDLAAARERHCEGAIPASLSPVGLTGWCYDCSTEWPCDAALALALADELAKALGDLTHQAAEVLLDHEDGTMLHPRDWSDLIAAVDDARAALAKWEASK